MSEFMKDAENDKMFTAEEVALLQDMARKEGRADMHREVMAEWHKPLGEILRENNGNFLHISDRLKALK